MYLDFVEMEGGIWGMGISVLTLKSFEALVNEVVFCGVGKHGVN